MQPKKTYYSFTVKELKFILFGKKKCISCGTELKRTKKFNIKKEDDVSSAHYASTKFSSDILVKEYYFEYICLNCGSTYSLKKLIKEKNQ